MRYSVLSWGRARIGLTSSLDSRDSPALKLSRDEQVHVCVGTGRVASREEMGLPRQKRGDEVAQSHGDAPGLVADPDELADPMTDVRVHGAEAFVHSFVSCILGGVDADTSHLPRENASVEAQVVSADAIALLEARGEVV